MKTRPSRQRGFSLLEVLVAVAILGLGLTVILSAQAGAFQSAQTARNMSVATGLLRCKMAEVEEHLYKDGFQEADETGAGPCCDNEETPNMRCTWRVDRPQFPEARFGDLDLQSGLNLGGSSGPGAGGPGGLGALGLLSQAGAGQSGMNASSPGDVAKLLADANAQVAAGAPPPSPMGTSTSMAIPGGPAMDPSSAGAGMGGLASMAMSIVYPNLKLLFEASTRRVVATVTYRQGNKEYAVEVTEWFCIPQKGLAVDDQSAQDTTSSSSSGRSSSGSSSSSSGKPR